MVGVEACLAEGIQALCAHHACHCSRHAGDPTELAEEEGRAQEANGLHRLQHEVRSARERQTHIAGRHVSCEHVSNNLYSTLCLCLL